MSRNIVICFDGTSNFVGTAETNILRLVRAVETNSPRQLVYYDAGIGTLPSTRYLTAIGAWFSVILGLAFGAGFFSKVIAAYIFLMRTFESGDRVFLFGFSRGAHTARVLAALLHTFGLLRRGNEGLVPFILVMLKKFRTQGVNSNVANNWLMLNRFRLTFSQSTDESKRFPIHFVGVWDTVGSVGWIWDLAQFNTVRNPSIRTFRHALALDERRSFFQPTLCVATPGQDVAEVWFSGSHGDVGGGYPDNCGLWRISFEWLLNEARAAGLEISEEGLHHVLSSSPIPNRPWLEVIHESLTGWWWLAEILPRRHYCPIQNKMVFSIGHWGARRKVPENAVLHKSVHCRIRHSDNCNE